MPHAETPNDNGETTVTEKTKRFFWQCTIKLPEGHKNNVRKTFEWTDKAHQKPQHFAHHLGVYKEMMEGKNIT